MNILIDIGHPAHVHLFKNLALELQKNNTNIFFTVRSGEKEAELLNHLGFYYKVLGKKKKGKAGKILGLITFSLKIFFISLKHKTDLFLSHGSMYAGYAAWLKGKPHIALEDSGNMEQLRFSIPVSDIILTPDILPEDLGKKQIRYKGYHELIYLHPNYFTPSNNIKSLLGLDNNQSYCLLRFSKFGASHDIRQTGLSGEEKKEIINYLSEKFVVFISSEGRIPKIYKELAYPLDPDKMHDFIANADLVISEGATIAAEAGVLGIPSVYINTIVRSYNEDLEKYGLVYNFRSFKGVTEKINEILIIPDYKKEFQTRRKKMLEEKIDVSSFLTWFIQSYPQSAQIMRQNPDYQYNFK